MKDAIYMVRSSDGTIAFDWLERSLDLARTQASECGVDRISVWIKPSKATRADPHDSVVAIVWSADDVLPNYAYDPEDYAYLGVFTVERTPPKQKLMAQSGALV